MRKCLIGVSAILSLVVSGNGVVATVKNDENIHPFKFSEEDWKVFEKLGLEAMLGKAGLDNDRRFLQAPTEPFFNPPQRQCGEIISTLSTDDVAAVAQFFVGAVLPPPSALGPTALAAITPNIRYSVRGRVICSTCDEIRTLYQGAAFLDDDQNENGFLKYCGPDRFGSNFTVSALLAEPIDPVTGEVVQGTVRPHVFMKSLTVGQQETPSEQWPNSTADLQQPNAFSNFFFSYFPMIAASTGSVMIAPDYFGYGQSWQEPKMVLVKRTYQIIAVVSYLKAKSEIEASGCTKISTDASASGFSEGGFAVVAATLALDAIGDMINFVFVQAGGAPLRIGTQLSFAISEHDNGTAVPNLGIVLPFVGASYSSLNPDLPNTNQGQDLINLAFQNETNYQLNVIEWSSSDQTLGTLGALLPEYPPEIYNPAVVARVQGLIAQGIMDGCATSVAGVDDLLCQAIVENSLIDEVESTTYPISICHSPEDDVISFDNAPDIASNDLVIEANLFGMTATGGHTPSLIFCLLNTLFPFTSFGSPDLVLNGIDPLEDNSTCVVMDTPVPVTMAPTMSPATNATTPEPTMAPNTTTPEPTMAPNTTTPEPTMAPNTTTPGPTMAPTSAASSVGNVWLFILGLGGFILLG